MSRRSGVSLMVGGALSLAFHVLYQIGHGPTEYNEQGVVLGLTNDQWSYLGFTWAGLVAVGVCGLVAADPERRNLRIVRFVLVGLLLGWMSSFLWVLYVPAQLLLAGSRAWLAFDAGRRRILPLWATVPTLVAFTAWLWLPIDADRVYDMRLGIGPWQIQYDEVLIALSAAAWVALGAGLLWRTARTTQRPCASLAIEAEPTEPAWR